MAKELEERKEDERKEEKSLGEKLLQEGEQIEKMEITSTQFYQTALKVQRPRDIDVIRKNLLKEADIAGEFFYYQWDVTDKNGKKHPVEGVTIKGAMAIARNYGNCAIPCDSKVNIDGSVTFKSAFVDLETGFTVARIFQAHFTAPPRKFSKDPSQRARWFDMQFQKAQSQAQRNVILNGVPFWMVDLVKDTAKTSTYSKIKKMGVKKAKDQLVEKFKDVYGVDLVSLENHLEKKSEAWVIRDIMTLQSIIRALEEGIDTPESIFNVVEGEAVELNAEELLAELWPLLDPAGIKAGDERVIAYIKSVAKFGKVEPVSYLADVLASFNEDKKNIEKFIVSVEKNHAEGKLEEFMNDDIPF